jgi:hypothetical protein
LLHFIGLIIEWVAPSLSGWKRNFSGNPIILPNQLVTVISSSVDAGAANQVNPVTPKNTISSRKASSCLKTKLKKFFLNQLIIT